MRSPTGSYDASRRDISRNWKKSRGYPAMTDFVELHRHLDGSLRPSTLEALAHQSGLDHLDASRRFFQGMGLQEALACFQVTIGVLQNLDSLKRVASEMCEDAAEEGIRILEIRFAPHLHTRGDATPSEVVDAVLDGVDGRASVLLCGLYGNSPQVFEDLVDIASPRVGVVGIDLAGGPTPADAWSMPDYAAAFARAREAGLGRSTLR